MLAVAGRKWTSCRGARAVLLRSLLPIAATLLLLATIWIGPVGFAVASLLFWQAVGRIRL